MTVNHRVAGSSPAAGATFPTAFCMCACVERPGLPVLGKAYVSRLTRTVLRTVPGESLPACTVICQVKAFRIKRKHMGAGSKPRFAFSPFVYRRIVPSKRFSSGRKFGPDACPSVISRFPSPWSAHVRLSSFLPSRTVKPSELFFMQPVPGNDASIRTFL